MADKITILNDKQLRQLAGLIYHQEVDAIRNIRFQSEPELAKYLRDSKTNYESVVGLLDAGGELEPKFQNNNTKAPIAHDIFSYVVEAINNALQSVRNYTLRMSYLHKIKKHADTLMDALKTLDPSDVASAEDLAKEAVQFKKAMSEYNKNHQGLRSRNFSRLLKEENLTLDQLVQRYQTKLKFGGPFENLEDEQKLQVYQKVIKASGREGFTGNLMSSIFGAVGIAVLLFAAGMMVWDIFSSEHVLKTATYDAVVTAASVGGAMLGEIVGTALATELLKRHTTERLDLDTARVTVKYSVNDVELTREYFTSCPDQVVVMKVSANKPGCVSFTVSLDSKLHHHSYVNGKVEIVMEGSCPGKGISPKVNANDNPKGIKFAAVLHLLISDGQGTINVLNNKRLVVEGSNWAVLLLVASSSFKGPFTKPSDSPRDPTSESIRFMELIRNLSYSDLLSRHLNDYQSLFHRASLQLSKSAKTASNDNSLEINRVLSSTSVSLIKDSDTISTPERVKSFQTDEDPSLVNFCFNIANRCLFLAHGLEPKCQTCREYGIKISSQHGSMSLFSAFCITFIINVVVVIIIIISFFFGNYFCLMYLKFLLCQ